MSALWEMGAATTREVHARVGDPAGLAYTTTATVLDRLHDKGCCSRQRLGKSFTYRAEITRYDVDRARAHDTIKQLIGGDPVPAIASLVDAVEALDPSLLAVLEQATVARRRLREAREPRDDLERGERIERGDRIERERAAELPEREDDELRAGPGARPVS